MDVKTASAEGLGVAYHKDKRDKREGGHASAEPDDLTVCLQGR